MIRHQLARILKAIADRIEPAPPRTEIQYVYVHNTTPYNPSPTLPPWRPYGTYTSGT